MGNPFVHNELHTHDVDAASKFYRKLFDWKLSTMEMGPGMTYTSIGVGEGVGGGMMKSPMPDAPAAWLSYVAVDSVKKAIAKAKKLGAKIVQDYQPVAGMGALGIFIDPTGAMLGVWEQAKKSEQKPSDGKKSSEKKSSGKKSAPETSEPKAKKKKKK